MEKRSDDYTFLLIPGKNDGKTFSLRLSRRMLVLAAALGVVAVALGIALFCITVTALKKMHTLADLKTEYGMLIIENNRWRLLNRKIQRLDTLAAYLEQLAGAAPVRPASGERIPFPSADAVRGNVPAPAPVPAAQEDSMPTTPPVYGWITQKFSNDTAPDAVFHPGIDIAAVTGTPNHRRRSGNGCRCFR